MYVCMSFPDMVIKDHACWGMISYVGEWHEEVHVYDESSGGVALTNLWVQYHVDMNWYYVIMMCLCLFYGR